MLATTNDEASNKISSFIPIESIIFEIAKTAPFLERLIVYNAIKLTIMFAAFKLPNINKKYFPFNFFVNEELKAAT